MFYSILGGMHSIVFGDIIKYAIMTVASLAIGGIAWVSLRGQPLNVPAVWYSPFFGARPDLDWSARIAEVNQKIKADGYSLFGIFFMMMAFKGVFASLAGPAPNYDMQKILSTRSPEEASKMSGFISIVLLPIRYSLIVGLTVLGLLYYRQMNINGPNGVPDFERILPVAINNFLPSGLLGLVLTGLLGAFMGTFSGTVNAAQAYIVNDIYLKYINANTRQLISLSYAVSVAVGVVLGVVAQFCLTLLPMYLILMQKLPLLVTVLLLAGVVAVLKRTWWNKLSDY